MPSSSTDSSNARKQSRRGFAMGRDKREYFEARKSFGKDTFQETKEVRPLCFPRFCFKLKLKLLFDFSVEVLTVF